MFRTARFALAALSALSLAHAQWTDVKQLGKGGEAYVSTDGKGNVYATSHEPGRLYVSHDFGQTFGIVHDLPDCMCDVTSTVGPDGKLYVIYIRPGVSGMQVMMSGDQGKTIDKGGVLNGPFDREWIVAHPKTGEIGYDYSEGYIGGPKSKGIFYARSTDGGKTFATLTRIDKEAEGHYPVDPYLTIGSEGRIYAAWATSSDYNKIDNYKFAASDDGGKTWTSHTEIGATHPGYGDTQERWMLGSIAASGPDTVMMVYEDYLSLSVDGKEMRPLLAFYRVSRDGGKTWASAKPCLSPKEITEAMRAYRVGGGDAKGPYIQTLPWLAADGKGGIHLAFVDNRAGGKADKGKTLGLWQVRFASWTPDGGFGASEAVSKAWPASRPPLDFLGCCADGENAWVIWTQNPDAAGGWDFSGDLYIARKKRAG